VFSGDLGNTPAPLIGATEVIEYADYCLIESTYGDRIHEDLPQRKEIIEDLIEDTVKARGTLLIPAFAMERTQELLYEIDDLAENGRIPRVPIFIDSPLAIKLIEVYRRYEKEYFNETVSKFMSKSGTFFNFKGLKLTETTEQSKAINEVPPPKVIIAGSGMSHGGRILHHERRYLPDPHSTLLIVGYQGAGSLGRQLLDGAREVRMFGETIPVRANIKAIGGYSAHADQRQLIDWLRPMRFSLRQAFVVQGEEEASAVFAQKIKDEMAVPAVIPQEHQTVVL
jgi:metallo-beta-lactamase family protein